MSCCGTEAGEVGAVHLAVRISWAKCEETIGINKSRDTNW